MRHRLTVRTSGGQKKKRKGKLVFLLHPVFPDKNPPWTRDSELYSLTFQLSPFSKCSIALGICGQHAWLLPVGRDEKPCRLPSQSITCTMILPSVFILFTFNPSHLRRIANLVTDTRNVYTCIISFYAHTSYLIELLKVSMS